MIALADTLRSIREDLPNGECSFKLLILNYFNNPGFRVLLNYRLGRYFASSRFILIRMVCAV